MSMTFPAALDAWLPDGRRPVRSADCPAQALLAQAQPTAFVQSLAAAAASSESVAGWYRAAGYDTLWTGAEDAARRAALFEVL
jgi:hypothetical protein